MRELQKIEQQTVCGASIFSVQLVGGAVGRGVSEMLSGTVLLARA